MAKKNDTGIKKIEEQATIYYEANAEKNAASKKERNATKELEKLMADFGETVVVKMGNSAYLEVGYMNSESEEIDPKLFMEKHPELFWELCKIPITAVKEILGDKEAALTSRVVTKNGFKAVKHKSDPKA